MKLHITKSIPVESGDVRVEFVTEKVFSSTKALEAQGFTGEPGQIAWASTDMVVVGVHPSAREEAWRDAAGAAMQAVGRLGARKVAFVVPQGIDGAAAGCGLTEGVLLASYRFELFKKGPERRVDEVTFVVSDRKQFARFVKAHETAKIVNDGVVVARDLVNSPPHVATPEHLAEIARDIAKRSKGRVKATVLTKEECEKRGMGAYLAVAQGSVLPPRFIHLSYTPAKSSRKKLAVVGKGITFDSGGLSLKPSAAMFTMKCDMAGAAAVLGFFTAVAALQPKQEVHGIIAACENMPSGSAMRPGDIARASNGKTIEIVDTDAEGRLTLADALHYAAELKPTAIVDLATLTGACIMALGEDIAGMMGNNDDLLDTIVDASDVSGEKFWELPLEKRYKGTIESDIADLRNLGTTRWGGAITAGLFLQEFVGDVPWTHLDIAGPAFAERPMNAYLGKGGTGFGVRTLVELLGRI